MINSSERIAREQAPAILAEAHAHTRQTLQGEIERLRALQTVNPNVRDEEIVFFEKQSQALMRVLESATPRLDAQRVIVTM
jgi:ATP-dependent helicase HepA